MKVIKSREICLMGGLGNQLFQFAFGRCISNFGAYQLVLDSSHASARKSLDGLPEICEVLGTDLFRVRERRLDRFSSKFRNLAIRSSGSISLSANVERAISRLTLEVGINIKSVSNDSRFRVLLANSLGYSKKLEAETSKNAYYIGYAQTRKYFAKIALEDVQTREICQRFVETAGQKWVKLAPDDCAIIHLRRGDYKHSKFGLLSNDYYRRALDLTTRKENIRKIYAISDGEYGELKEDLKNISSDIEFIPSRRLRSAEVLGLMSQFRIIIGANSSLSWWASALGGIAKKNIAAFPASWFEGIPSPKDLFLPEWTIIEGENWKNEFN
jgi:hypothetical protein